MKEQAADVAIEEFFGLKSKIYSFLINDSSEDKRAKIGLKSY